MICSFIYFFHFHFHFCSGTFIVALDVSTVASPNAESDSDGKLLPMFCVPNQHRWSRQAGATHWPISMCIVRLCVQSRVNAPLQPSRCLRCDVTSSPRYCRFTTRLCSVSIT
jgi:hypothetical protein